MKQIKSKFNNIRFPFEKWSMWTLKHISVLLFSAILFGFSPSTIVSEKLNYNNDIYDRHEE